MRRNSELYVIYIMSKKQPLNSRKVSLNGLIFKRDVSQDWVMCLDLFNLYSKFILKQLEEFEEGLQVNGRRINNIRYADDAVLLSSSEADLQMLLNVVQTSSEEFGLKLNINRTKAIVMSKQSPNESSISITVNNIKIE